MNARLHIYNKWSGIVLIAILLNCSLCSCQTSAQNQGTEGSKSKEVVATTYVSSSMWPIQLGSPGDDSVGRVLTDQSGAIYLIGSTTGSLFGVNSGDEDCFIAKYDNGGNLLWGKQFGSSQQDAVLSASIDATNNLVVIGVTNGNLFGTQGGSSSTPVSDGDAFIAKFSSDGLMIWSKQVGTPQVDAANGVAIDNLNNIYLVGSTTGSLFGTNTDVGSDDVFVVKYDVNGNQLWGKQFDGSHDDQKGSSEDIGEDIALDSTGNIYIGGMTSSLFGPNTDGYDAFIAKLGPGGDILWGKQFGTDGRDEVRSVCVDHNGNIYVGGNMNQNDDLDGDASDDPGDAFIGKFDSNGNQLWMNQWSTPSDDSVSEIILDNLGDVYALGGTEGSLFGTYSENSGDAAVAEYAPNGNIMWSNQYSVDGGFISASINSHGNFIVAGGTEGSLFRTWAGGNDIFIQMLSSGGQMASTKLRTNKNAKSYTDGFGIKGQKSRSLSNKALRFAWNGQTMPLSFPPLLISEQPYVYVGYLCYDLGRGKTAYGQHGAVSVTGKYGDIELRMNDATYQIKGKTHKMIGKPVLQDGRCYVPLDVIKAVLPVAIHYEAKAKLVRFDPPRMAMR